MPVSDVEPEAVILFDQPCQVGRLHANKPIILETDVNQIVPRHSSRKPLRQTLTQKS
jgi:hypothetical protein